MATATLSQLSAATSISSTDLMAVEVGGELQSATVEDVVTVNDGMRLVLLDEEDRPSSWVLNGGTATSFTDVDFGAAVTLPANVKALLLHYVIMFAGNNTIDSAIAYFRKNGSAETDMEKLTQVGHDNYNAPTGSYYGNRTQITIGCDSDGIIEYCCHLSTSQLYLNIGGYYI